LTKSIDKIETLEQKNQELILRIEVLEAR